MTIGTLLVATVYQSSKSQKQSKDSQNDKNDHWCTNRHMSTKTVPTVYQSSKTVKKQSIQLKRPLVYQSSHVYQDCINRVPTKTIKNSQKTVKTAKMTIGVPIVTCLHRVRRIHKVRARVRRLRPPNTQSPYRSSIDTVALNCLLF